MTANETLAKAFQAHRPALTTFATRMIARSDVAEELVQQAAVRALEQPTLPSTEGELRAWLFRVVTNLAIDHLRRDQAWPTDVLQDTRTRALADGAFVAESRLMVGSPELGAIAREHLEVCFSCTSRALLPHQAAALLLKEVSGFTVDETAQVMEASLGQVKNWLQSARAALDARYASTCALVTKQGACFQCVELDRFFGANRGDPLDGTARDLDARLALLRADAERRQNPWHRQMMRLVDEVLGSPGARRAP